MADALSVDKLCKTYPGFALKDVSFSLPEGYIMGFVGQNGAGKTTTIKCVLNMLAHEGGNIEVLGRDAITDDVAVKQDVGVVFDQPFFPAGWTVAQVGETAPCRPPGRSGSCSRPSRCPWPRCFAGTASDPTERR